MAAEFSTSPSNPLDASRPFVIVHFTNAQKLTPTNYITWKSQVRATLTGYDLFKFVSGDHPAPPATLSTESGTAPNPNYNIWTRQDQLLYGALVGTLSSQVAPILIEELHEKLIIKELELRSAAAPSGFLSTALNAQLRPSRPRTRQPTNSALPSPTYRPPPPHFNTHFRPPPMAPSPPPRRH